MNDFIIIGAGQAGLAMSYELSKQNKKYLVLDANSELGAPWLKRWDSLKLFTPSEFNNLPGLDFPYPKGHYANKFEVAAYLKQYAKEFNIPIEFNQKVIDLEKVDTVFNVKSADKVFKAKNVIIATGPFHTPFTPSFQSNMAESIIQIHSENYKGPSQLQEGPALVVGAGDSGVQILKEISETNRKVYFSGNTNITSIPQEFLGKTLWWWFDKLGLLSVSKYSWLGKKLASSVQPVIGTDVKSLFNRENVFCVGRCLSADKEEISFEKGRFKDVKNVVWATGFKPNFKWIKGISYDNQNYPKNKRGVSEDVKGLYFVGLPWLYTRGSATLGGVKKDTKYLSKCLFDVV